MSKYKYEEELFCSNSIRYDTSELELIEILNKIFQNRRFLGRNEIESLRKLSNTTDHVEFTLIEIKVNKSKF